MNYIRIGILTAVGLFLNTFSFSQKYFFEQLTTAEGLPSDYVNSVFRDSRGFLWIATDKGACRYDGQRFIYLNKDNGLPSNFVNCFAEDPSGNIWMGMTEGGLCRFDGSRVHEYNSRFEGIYNNTRQIHFNSDKSFFIVTLEGLYYCRSEKDIPEKMKGYNGFLAPIPGNRFITGKGKDSILVLSRHTGGFKAVLLRFPGLFRISGASLIKRKGQAFESWELNGDSPVHKRNFSFPGYRVPDDITQIKKTLLAGNALLIATVSGLYYADGHNNAKFLDASSGMGSDYIRNLYEDDAGNLFICTFGGGVKIWPSLYLREFKTNGKVTSIFHTAGLSYITTTRELYGYNHPGNKLYEYPEFSGGHYTAVYQNDDGKLYIGTMNSFYRLPPHAPPGNITKKQLAACAVTVNSGTSGFVADKQSVLFLSTYGDGIIPVGVTAYNLSASIHRGKPPITEFLYPLKNGFAALTYSTGLTLFNTNDAPVEIGTRDGLLSNTVYAVFEEDSNRLWIGTFKGLNFYQDKKVIKTYTEKNGLVGNKVLCVFRDKARRLWVLSDRFLHLLEGNQLRAIRSHPLLYDAKNSINRAAYDSIHNTLHIGLNDALLVTDISRIRPDTVVNPVLLSAISINDRVVAAGLPGTIKLKPGNRKLVFAFARTYHPLSKQSDRYYMLKGYDDEWQKLGEQGEVLYNKLPPGSFTLLSKTINPDGYTLPEQQLMVVEVLPPFWQRTWFILASLVFLLAAFFVSGQLMTRKKFRQRLRKLKEEQKIQREKERIARELHDNVGSRLTYLINKIDDDYALLADKEEAGKLTRVARGAMQELRETIWALDKKDITLPDLYYKINQLAMLLDNGKNIIQVSFEPDQQEKIKLNSLQALNTYRIIQESLNNAVKYSKAGRITVTLIQANKKLYVAIADNGHGFNTAGVMEGYGLRNMKSRAAEMQADLRISSAEGKGTEVAFSVPVS